MYSRVYSGVGSFAVDDTILFDELILSWNGKRPVNSLYTFRVRVQDEWFTLAEWGVSSQRTFSQEGKNGKCYQDVVTTPTPIRGFAVDAPDIRLHVALSNTKLYSPNIEQYTSVCLTPELQSQQVLPHPRAKDLCSPTSVSNAIAVISGHRIDPVLLAENSRDEAFDIYGNWILNVAEAHNRTGLPCRVERLPNFGALHAHLIRGKPVVVSVKGAIPGAPKDYPSGHLICVIGYENNQVICIDPAFPRTEETLVRYKLEDFMRAWGIRRGLSYVFL